MTEREYTAYFEKPEFKAILARYEAMEASGEKSYFDPEQLTDIAEYYATRNREKDAELVIDYALAMHPGSTDPLIFRARTYMLKGDIDTARLIAESIPDQKDREVIFLYAELMLNEGRQREAEMLLVEELLANEKSHKEYVFTVRDIVELYFDYVYTSEATVLVQKTMEKLKQEDGDPKLMTMARNIFVDCLWNEGRLDETIEQYNILLDENPYGIPYWIGLGYVYNQMEKFEQAIESLDYALAVDPECLEALFVKGHSYALLGNTEKALELYRICLKKGYDKPLTSYTCGVLEIALGFLDEAIAHLEYAYSVYGDTSFYSFSICFNLAIANIKVGDLQRAAAYYYRAYQINPDDETLAELMGQINRNDDDDDKKRIIIVDK